MNNSEEPTQETEKRWRKDPDNWIWGMFYYNKDDKRLFVSKKVEWMGTTLNFANPKSVFFMIGFLSFFTFILTMILTKK